VIEVFSSTSSQRRDSGEKTSKAGQNNRKLVFVLNGEQLFSQITALGAFASSPLHLTESIDSFECEIARVSDGKTLASPSLL